MKNNISKLALLLFLLLSTKMYAQLTAQERKDLIFTVRNDYYMDGIDGVRIYDTSHNWVAVVFQISTTGLGPQDRGEVAKINARESLGEFFKGAETISQTIHTIHSESSESIQKTQNDLIAGDGSSVSKNKENDRQRIHGESLDKKVIAKAKANLKNVQSLTNFKGPNGESVRCDFIILKRSTAKRKQ